MRLVGLIFALAITLETSSLAQHSVYAGKPVQDASGRGIPASILVCSKTATGFPCSPTATIYTVPAPPSDPGSGTVIPSSTVVSDANGNYTFGCDPGLYLLQITAGGTVYSFVDNCPSIGSGGGTLTASGSPSAGNIPKFTSPSNLAPAASTDLIALWSGTCNGTTFLRADGSCQAVGGGGGNITPGINASQFPVWSVGSSLWGPQNKAIYDTRDWATCDGAVDSTTTGPQGGIGALITAIGAKEATIRWIGSTTPGAHCRLDNILIPGNITNDFSGGGAIEMISSTTPPGGAVFVQGTGAECGATTSCGITLTFTAGNTIVLLNPIYPGFSFKTSSVTDTCGDVFYKMQQTLANQPRNESAWAASNVHGGSCTVTANYNGTVTNSQVIVQEYSGMGPVVSADGLLSDSRSTGTTMSSGSATVTTGSLLIGYGGQPFTSETCTAGAGYTQPAGTSGQTSSGFLCAEYHLAAAGGSTSATQTITVDPSPGTWVYALLALKPGNATATILGGILDPDLHQIFYNANATSTQGVIDFTNAAVLDAVRPEWWGASSTASATTNTQALQAAVYGAFGCGPTPCRINGSQLNQFNRPLYLTSQYTINDELKFYHVINFKVVCAGRLNSGIIQGGTNKRIIDGQSIAYGAFYDCGWSNSGSSTNALIDLDFSGTQGNDLRPQFIDFYNNSFSGNGVTDVGVLIAKSGGGAQGSNIYCYDCNASGFTGAAWQIGGNNTGRNVGRFGATNALDIAWYGGDMQGNPLYGIADYSGGYIFLYGTSMENGFSTQTGYDMYCEVSQGPCVMYDVRSESRRLAAGTTLEIYDSAAINQASYLPPGQTFPIGSIMTGSAVGGDGAYYKVTNNGGPANGIGTPSAPILASGGSSTTIADTNQNIAGSNTIKTFLGGETVTQAVTGSTGVVLGVPNGTATVAGTLTSGLFTGTETVTQSVTGVTATEVFPTPNNSGPVPLSITNLSGTADNTHTWVGGTSGAVFTPSAAPSFPASTMMISAATGAPDNTHNWTGGTSAAVFVPTAAPVNVVNFTVNGFVGMLASVLSGSNLGCYGVITANTATSITVGAGWITKYNLLPCPNPDNTSNFVVEPNWNEGTVTDGGMTLVFMNEDAIGGCNPGAPSFCGGFNGTLFNVAAFGGTIHPSPRTTVMKGVITSRQDWFNNVGGGDPQSCCDVNLDWDVRIQQTVSSTIVPYVGTYNQNWSYPSISGTSFSGPFQNNMGRRVFTWSIGTLGTSNPPANTSANDVWLGGRSDPGAGTDPTRAVLEFGGMLGRASQYPKTNGTGTDTDITGGPSTGSANGGAINFWTSNPGSAGFQTNSGLKRWLISTAGHFFAGLDNTYDIGASAASRPRNINAATSTNVGDPLFGSSQTNSRAACETTFGITTLSTVATTTDTGLQCLPANSVIDAVVYRITTTITTAASFTIGDATTAARFCSTQSTLTAGTTGVCFVQVDQTGAPGPRQVSAASVRVTTNINPAAGAIRLVVYYHTWTPPTS
jgi:hypothetical protein